MKKLFLTILAMAVIGTSSYATCEYCKKCCPVNSSTKCENTVTNDCNCAKCEKAKAQLENCKCSQCSKDGCKCSKCEKAKNQIEDCKCDKCTTRKDYTCPTCDSAKNNK